MAALDLRLGLRDGAVSTLTSARIWTRFVPSDTFDFDLGPSNKILFARRTWALSAASMTPMLVGRFSSLGRLLSALDGEAGCGILPEGDLIDLVGDAGGLGSTARPPFTQLSRDGNRNPPGGEGGSAVTRFVGAPATVERGGDVIAECGDIFIDNLVRSGGRGGTGGTDDGTAGRGPFGGGRGSGGGVSERDIARLRCRGEKPIVGGASKLEGEATSGNTAARCWLGVVERTRGEDVPELDGSRIGNVGDEFRATGDVGGDVQSETQDSVSEGAWGATPTAGRNASTSAFREGTTSARCCECLRPSNGSSRMLATGRATHGANDSARGVGSSSKLSDSLCATECEASVPSKDDRACCEISEVGSTVLRLLLTRTLVADSLPKTAGSESAAA